MKISNFFSSISFIISCVVLSYVFYRSEIYFQGAKFDHYLKYYIFFSILLILSCLSFFISHKIRQNIFLFLITFGSSIYLLEFSILYYNYFNSTEYKLKKINNEYDERSKYDFYIDFKKKNPEVVLDVPPSLIYEDEIAEQKKYLKLPLSSISKKETVWCNEDGNFVTYTSDRFGFNNQDKEWDKKKHIIFLGDSYTQGVCVNSFENIPSKFKDSLNNDDIGVINLGIRGNGPLSEYASFVEYSKALNPIAIFWLYYEGNDLKNLKFESQVKTLQKYLENKNFSQNLINYQNYLDNVLYEKFLERLSFELDTKKQIKDNKILFGLKLHNLRMFIRSKLKKDSLDKKEYYRSQLINFDKIVKKMKILSNKLNSELIFVYLPSFERTEKRLISDKKMYNYENIINIIKGNNIKFIDVITDLFQKSSNPKEYYPFELPLHFSSYGYSSIAKILYEDTEKLIDIKNID